MLYGDFIMDHFRHPRNYGALENPDMMHEDVNPLCGDRIRIEVKVDDSAQVHEIGFVGDACIIGQAASSILTDMVKGWSIEAIKEIEPSAMLQALQVQIRPARVKCALLPLEILQTAVTPNLSA